MDARWQEIDRVFEEAVEVPEAARGTWIQDRCQGDRDLEQAVLRLLESDRQSESFLARPLSPVEPPPTLDADERGRRVGAYRLIEPISHGGMGSVYLAERDDDHYRRRVALKLVRRGFLEEELYSRFVQERQILAGLEHPYIARLYEGGTTEDGRPYLVMEYVEGLP
ncbi:MAG: protein kinase, partial [Acidobacteria bacterium]|nr:protein kinase [Acidobacteriota bacterium]